MTEQEWTNLLINVYVYLGVSVLITVASFIQDVLNTKNAEPSRKLLANAIFYGSIWPLVLIFALIGWLILFMDWFGSRLKLLNPMKLFDRLDAWRNVRREKKEE